MRFRLLYNTINMCLEKGIRMRSTVFFIKKQKKITPVLIIANKNKQLNKEKKKEDENCELPCAEMALQVVLNEYNITFDTSNALATRGGVLLSALLAAFILSLTYISFDKMILPTVLLKSNPLFYLLNFLVFAYVACSILSFISLIQSTNTSTFQGVNCEDIDDKKYLSYPKDKIAASIISALTNNMKTNDKNNLRRARKYRIGAWLGASSVAIFIIVVVLQKTLLP